MINKSFSIWAACFIFTAILAVLSCSEKKPFHCNDTLGCVDIEPGEPIELGVMQLLSGDLKPQGMMQVRAIEMCIANRGGQLLDHPVKLHVTDSGCTEETGINAALKLTTNPRIIGIIGTYCSSSAAAAIPLISRAGMVMISGTNSAPSLTSSAGKKGANNYPGYFRTMYNGRKMAEMAAVFAYEELGKKKAATINDGDNFTLELTAEFEHKFKELGGNIVSSMGINKGDKDMMPALEAISFVKPDVIYFPLFQPEAVSVIVQSKNVPGFENTALIGEGGANSETFIEAVGRSGIGLYLSIPGEITGKKYDELLKNYEAQYKEKPIHFSLPYIYDAAGLLFSTIESIAVKNPDGSLHIGREALRKAMYGIKDYKGLTGNLTADLYGDLFRGSASIIRLDDPSSGYKGFQANVVYQFQ